jgi:RND family efflux transporter MFP subunit
MSVQRTDPALEAAAEGEAALWQRLATADTPEALAAPWLELQCRDIAGAAVGLLLLGPADRGPFRPAAVWPAPRTDVTHLAPAAEEALKSRRGATRTAGEQRQIALPVSARGALRGAVVVEIGPDGAPAAARRRLLWGAAWLELVLLRQNETAAGDAGEPAYLALDLLAVVLDQQRFQAGASALVTELAHRLDCDRVSLGFDHQGQQRVQAISHTATFGKEMNLVRLVGTAMDEAVDQGDTLLYPDQAADARRILRAHGELARQHGAGHVLTVPVAFAGHHGAALTLERPEGRPFGEREVALVEAVGALAGPVLQMAREQERWLPVKAWLALKRQLERLFGPGHVIRKTVLAGLVLVALFLTFARGDYRITADTVVEGAVQRSVVAPYDGYIAEARVRAGDLVEAGQLLATLDDRDLKLERLKVSTERAQRVRERREKVAEGERAEARVLSAQIEQAEAELALLDEQLARTRLSAPFAGVVVSGDLSQSLGAPVRQGDVLFEVAPLDSYRLILRVDEQDIADTQVGQPGTLVLGALPDRPLDLAVTRITPVTVPEEGRNYFRVEARLEGDPARVRPGMEGVAKVDAGTRSLAWIWTRRLVTWVRLQLWRWWP